MWAIKYILIGLLIPLAADFASAGKVKRVNSQKHAYFTEDTNGFYKGLNLITKEVKWSLDDVDACGSNLKRKTNTLKYFCKLNIPNSHNVAKLERQITKQMHSIQYGRINKTVLIDVDPTGKRVQFSVDFDSTGINFSVLQFNKEFFAIYAKTAQNLIRRVMKNQPLRLKTVEYNN